MLYETARKELMQLSFDQKIPSLKLLRAEKDTLISIKNQQYEDYAFSRSKFKEIKTIHTNVLSILGEKYKTLHKTNNLQI